jgi:flagellin-like hook-associated protein FlgL
MDAAGNVVYSGNSTPTESYVDVNQLFPTSVTGVQAFGAISQPVQGAALTPALSSDTPLADLNGGQGVAPGSIAISDGHSTSVVNLSGAQTLGDVAALIEQNPPAGRTVDVDVTSTGLTLQLQPDSAYPNGDNLSVQEVNGGTTASNLGILDASGVGSGPLVGRTLSATVTPATALGDLLGTTAQANIRFGEPNSDIILQANTAGATTSSGALLNGVTVQFVADAPSGGKETASYNPGTPASGNNPGTAGTLTVHISTSAASASTAGQIVAAINKVAGLPFTASLDPADQNGGGQPPITTLPAATTTTGGGGTTLDTAGLQITSQGKTYTIDLSGDKTVQDLLNSINDCGAGLDAQINSAKNGIDVSSQVSGSDFSIGENGGITATQLGLRTFTAATQLTQLNQGVGVGVNTATPGGTDFTISETVNGAAVQVPVSIAGDSTVGDVLASINAAAQSAGATVRAQLATSGNGIELTDYANGPITVTANTQSTAAVDLGLIPTGQTSATSTGVTTAGGIESSGPNSELYFQAVNPGAAGDVQVVFQANAGITEGNETVQYDPVAKTLTFQISPQTTANDIIAALKNSTAGASFTAALDSYGDANNNGSGIIQPQQIAMAGGEDVLQGSDANPQQTDSIFNALLKLGTALTNNDNGAVQQAMTLLSNSMQNLGNARDVLGVQEQSLSALNTQISNEETNLQSTMSTDYDTDMASAVSNYTGAQIAYQATLETTASMLKMTLLNYL